MTPSWIRAARLAAVVLAGGAFLAGCAPATRVVLLPDADGHVGEVLVVNASGEQRLADAYTEVTVDAPSAVPGAARAVDRPAFERTHRALLEAQPEPPRSYTLYFRHDSRELTPDSQALLPQVLQTVRERSPTEVIVVGHADGVGQTEYNLALSAQRARAVDALLRKLDPGLPTELRYFGDKDPLVPAPAGVPEPRNRRVEVMIL